MPDNPQKHLWLVTSFQLPLLTVVIVSRTFQALFDKAVPGTELAGGVFSLSWLILPPPTQRCHQMGDGRWSLEKDTTFCDPTELVIFLAKEAEDERCKGMNVHAIVQGKSKPFCLAEIQNGGDKPAQVDWVYANPLGSGEPLKIFLTECFIWLHQGRKS